MQEKTTASPETPIEEILFPVKTFTFQRNRWAGVEHLQVRTLTMRELFAVQIGVGDLVNLATGQPLKWLKRMTPLDRERLAQLIQEMNNFKELEALSAKDGAAKNGGEITIQHVIGKLQAGGHNPQTILDLTPRQVVFWYELALEAEKERYKQALLDADTIRTAVWGTAENFKTFRASLDKVVQQPLMGARK